MDDMLEPQKVVYSKFMVKCYGNPESCGYLLDDNVCDFFGCRCSSMQAQNEKNGLYHKYDVFNAKNGCPVLDCFVLRPDRDPAAVYALRAYAKATENKELAADIIKWVGEGAQEPNRVLTAEEIAIDGVSFNPKLVYVEVNPILSYYVGDEKLCMDTSELLMWIQNNGMYGRLYRAWLRRPTDSERAAAPWVTEE